MSFIIPFGAVIVSGTTRIMERFLSTTSDAERYINGEIGFKQATDGIVKNIHIYIPLTTTKLICDAIVLSVTGKWMYDLIINVRSIFNGLINCGYQAFQDGIKLSLNHIFTALRNCSVNLILCQFKQLYDKRKNPLTSFSIHDFCHAGSYIHLFIVAQTNGFTKTIQIELMKYWLECMGMIRAIAESHNIDFVKYMNKSYSKETNTIEEFSSNTNPSFHFIELQWSRVKDPDFIQIITIPLQDIFEGTERTVTVRREIREVDKPTPEYEEAKYTVIIEPGCADRQTFRFIEAGHRDPVNTAADLVVEVQTAQHELYQRSGSDLIYTANVSLEDALHGSPVNVPLIDGRTEECNPRGVITPHTELVIDQAGLPDPANGGTRGRLIVKFDIKFPDTRLGIEPNE